MSTKKTRIIVVVTLLVLASAAVAYQQLRGSGVAAKVDVGVSAVNLDESVAATVNGEKIYETEILADMQAQGGAASRNDVLEAYINRVLAAQSASKDKATAAIQYAQRQVLSNLFLTTTQADEAAKITAEDIKAFYDKNVVDSAYNRYSVSYYLTQDQADAMARVEDFAAGRQEKLKILETKEGKWVRLQDIPYGTGQIVASMSKGGITTKPLMVRDGLLILKLLDVQPGKKPSLDEMTPQIKNLLLQNRIGALMMAKRKSADIRIK